MTLKLPLEKYNCTVQQCLNNDHAICEDKKIFRLHTVNNDAYFYGIKNLEDGGKVTKMKRKKFI